MYQDDPTEIRETVIQNYAYLMGHFPAQPEQTGTRMLIHSEFYCSNQQEK